jgi:GNAT superfamily N-acetyltransferase
MDSARRQMTVRPMGPEDLAFALDLAAQEGWTPGLHDAPCFYACDPGGFLLGEVDGRPIGCVSAVRYGPSFGFLGLYIVAPEFRGLGYGTTLWNAALEHLGDRCVGLDGVLEKEGGYQRSGFITAYGNVRFSGSPGPRPPALHKPRTPPAPPGREEDPPGSAPFEIRAACDAPREALHAYDRVCFPADRAAFVDCWIRMPDSRALCAVSGGRVLGWGAIKACLSGYKIGPLFADDYEVAESLYLALCSAVPEGETVHLDVPEVNPAGVALAQAHGLREAFRTVRMYRGPEPAAALDRVFGVTTFELG